MNIQYFKNYSPALGRDMECKLYGHGGQPILFIPCQDGRFFDFENFHMTDVWAPWIDSGEVTIFTVDTIDAETWSNTNGDPRFRICRHEDWFRYLTDEMVPFIHAKMKGYQPDYISRGIIAFGCSLGATHAANLYFRRPDLFNGLLALSGIYDASYGFGSYMDDLVYMNSRFIICQICRQITLIWNFTASEKPFSASDRVHGKNLQAPISFGISCSRNRFRPG